MMKLLFHIFSRSDSVVLSLRIVRVKLLDWFQPLMTFVTVVSSVENLKNTLLLFFNSSQIRFV